MAATRNILDQFKGFLLKLIGLVFQSQSADPLSGSGKPHLWVKSGDKKLHYTDTDGTDNTLLAVGDIDFNEVGDVASVSTAKAAGTSVEVARADHVHDIAAGTLAADATGRAIMAASFFNAATVDAKFATDAIGEDRLTANEVTGRVLANVGDVPTTPGIPVVIPVAVADAATGDIDIVLAAGVKIRVYDVVIYKTGANGGAANTVQVKNGANAISDAISININDQTIARAGTIDDAQNEVAGGGTLRVTRTKAGGNAACQVQILAYRVA